MAIKLSLEYEMTFRSGSQFLLVPWTGQCLSFKRDRPTDESVLHMAGQMAVPFP
jgi:hypothetical protein